MEPKTSEEKQVTELEEQVTEFKHVTPLNFSADTLESQQKNLPVEACSCDHMCGWG